MKTAAEVWLDQIEHENDNSDDSDGDEDAEDGKFMIHSINTFKFLI